MPRKNIERSKFKSIGSERGATLAELLFSILLFSFGLVAIFDVSLQSLTAAPRAAHSYRAYSLAKNHIETLRYVGFADLASANETDTLINEEGISDRNGEYKRSTQVIQGTSANFLGDANLAYARVSVAYKIKGFWSPLPMEASTYIYSNG